MGVFQVTMKTHSREDITEQHIHDLNDCAVHKHKPKIFKMVVGKRKETFYVAQCDSDDCSKISDHPTKTVLTWNKYNPITIKF